jgi:hypothetical protein
VAEDLSAVPAVVLQKGGSGRIRGGDFGSHVLGGPASEGEEGLLREGMD